VGPGGQGGGAPAVVRAEVGLLDGAGRAAEACAGATGLLRRRRATHASGRWAAGGPGRAAEWLRPCSGTRGQGVTGSKGADADEMAGWIGSGGAYFCTKVSVKSDVWTLAPSVCAKIGTMLERVPRPVNNYLSGSED
jgi:hypothetical protein